MQVAHKGAGGEPRLTQLERTTLVHHVDQALAKHLTDFHGQPMGYRLGAEVTARTKTDDHVKPREPFSLPSRGDFAKNTVVGARLLFEGQEGLWLPGQLVCDGHEVLLANDEIVSASTRASLAFPSDVHQLGAQFKISPGGRAWRLDGTRTESMLYPATPLGELLANYDAVAQSRVLLLERRAHTWFPITLAGF